MLKFTGYLLSRSHRVLFAGMSMWHTVTSSRAFSNPRRRKPRDSRICQPLCREVAPKGLFIYTLFTHIQHNTATPYLSSHTQGGFLSNVRVVLGACIYRGLPGASTQPWFPRQFLFVDQQWPMPFFTVRRVRPSSKNHSPAKESRDFWL